MNCQDCKARMYPADPSQPFYANWSGRYLRPICETCPNFNPEEPKQVEHIHIHRQSLAQSEFRLLEETSKRVQGVERALANHLSKKKGYSY